jgi:hypothetical protein
MLFPTFMSILFECVIDLFNFPDGIIWQMKTDHAEIDSYIDIASWYVDLFHAEVAVLPCQVYVNLVRPIPEVSFLL